MKSEKRKLRKFIFYFLLSLLLLLLLNSNIISKIQLFFFNIEYLDN